MSGGFTPEQEDFRHTVREFAAAEIAPHAGDWDRAHRLPLDVVAKMGQLGLFGLTAPEEYGGSGAGLTELCIAIEEVGRADQSLGITLEAAVGLGIHPILSFGTTAQQDRWLPDLVAGRALAGFGLTEPEAGSDAGATRTRAVRAGAEWVIDGAKQFITNSGTAITSCVTITARTGTTPDGDAEISALIVPSGTPGFTVEPAYDKLGWRASDTHPLTFTGCRVPATNLLGERGAGFRQFLATLDDGRVAIAALATGCAQACCDLALAYAKQRHTFGAPIGSRQAVAFQVADLHVLAESARAVTYRAAALRDAARGRDAAAARDDPCRPAGGPAGGAAAYSTAASVAKLHATEAAVTATRVAAQVFGGYGFLEEFPIARFYRDAKILEIGEGTSEVQRLIIARALGLPVR